MSIISKYQKVRLLGEGSYGRAVLVRDKTDSQLFVIKEVDLSKNSNREDALKEVKFMSVLCKHPNIVLLREWFEDKANRVWENNGVFLNL